MQREIPVWRFLFKMKKIKAYLVWFIWLCLLVLTGITGISLQTRASGMRYPKEQVTAAYNRYYKKYFYSRRRKYPNLKGKRYDFNRDGIEELILSYASGGRTTYRFFTYQKGKIVRLHKKDAFRQCDALYVMKGKQYIVTDRTPEALRTYTTCWRIKGRKLERVCQYLYEGDPNSTAVSFYKNGKKISGKTYRKFLKQLRYLK